MSMLYYDLSALRADVWNGDLIVNETLLFTPDPVTKATRPCRLLCRPQKLLRVCSASGLTDYRAGEDYLLEGDRIVPLPGGRMPRFSFEEYFLREPAAISIRSASCPGRFVRYEPDGLELHRRQVLVSYSHAEVCGVPCPPGQLSRLPQAARRLRLKQPLNVLFYGDSFISGCDASGRSGLAPYLPPLDRLTALLLAEAWEHPAIQVSNTAVGGTTSRWGAEQAQERVAALLPDLTVVRFGMNDSGAQILPEAYAQNLRSIIKTGREANPQMEFLLLSSETPNPDCLGWTGLQRSYEPALRALADSLPGCGFLSMGALFDAAARRKGYPSLSANLVNHPNDFMIRIYASAITQALLDSGCEDMR